MPVSIEIFIPVSIGKQLKQTKKCNPYELLQRWTQQNSRLPKKELINLLVQKIKYDNEYDSLNECCRQIDAHIDKRDLFWKSVHQKSISA